MKTSRPAVDYPLCMACGACAAACPFGCLDLTATRSDGYGKVYPELAKPDACTGCGLCAKACPVECLDMVERS